MTAIELAALVTRTCLVTVGKMRFRATIVAAGQHYGNDRVLLEPESGDGQAWKNLDTVKLLTQGVEKGAK